MKLILEADMLVHAVVVTDEVRDVWGDGHLWE